MGADALQAVDAWTTLAGRPQVKRADRVGMVERQPPGARRRPVRRSLKKRDLPAAVAPSELALRDAATGAVELTQVDDDGSPQRSAFPGGSVRK